jgi:hypothetical protein
MKAAAAVVEAAPAPSSIFLIKAIVVIDRHGPVSGLTAISNIFIFLNS